MTFLSVRGNYGIITYFSMRRLRNSPGDRCVPSVGKGFGFHSTGSIPNDLRSFLRRYHTTRQIRLGPIHRFASGAELVVRGTAMHAQVHIDSKHYPNK